MRRIKFGVAVIFLLVIIYFFISYGIFFSKKSSIDSNISFDQKNIEQALVQKNSDEKFEAPVIVQNIDEVEDESADQRELILSLVSEPKSEYSVSAEPTALGSYSFVTMPISDDYVIDAETWDIFDYLLGNNLEEFVQLVLQSNNDVVSQQSCRPCAMYAFFKKIKNHKQLSREEIIALQKIIGNLYRFIETMQKISKNKKLISDEQYRALQDLNRSQAARNDLKLQARRAATLSALKKLQAIQYNR